MSELSGCVRIVSSSRNVHSGTLHSLLPFRYFPYLLSYTTYQARYDFFYLKNQRESHKPLGTPPDYGPGT